ncbi:high mobility group B protein 3-like [Prosopis cineraria]|uniref:high mobility group B protein 3-like n=1 Tax=Prosopis cineraria TaxID=364024 RepID=UPI00240FC0B7|nr:high mobility group B protein 3-like [Prosopis cineraria]
MAKEATRPRKRSLSSPPASASDERSTRTSSDREDFRKEFQEQNPDVKSMRDIGKACGEKWKTMTYEEKVQYYDIATEKRAEFDRAMIEYNMKMESGEYEETDEESEFDVAISFEIGDVSTLLELRFLLVCYRRFGFVGFALRLVHAFPLSLLFPSNWGRGDCQLLSLAVTVNKNPHEEFTSWLDSAKSKGIFQSVLCQRDLALNL